MSQIREGAVVWGGKPANLQGPEIKAGQPAPEFSVVATDMSTVSSKDLAGKVLILAAVPSLDTPVCDIEIRRFNEEAAHIPEVHVLTVSMDLPFAQKRWCGAAGVERVRAVSDHRSASFGLGWGVLQPERRLLARAVFVVDKKGKVRHAEYTKAVGDQPNFEAAISAAKAAAAEA
jgi:thiol peroxidase